MHEKIAIQFEVKDSSPMLEDMLIIFQLIRFLVLIVKNLDHREQYALMHHN